MTRLHVAAVPVLTNAGLAPQRALLARKRLTATEMESMTGGNNHPHR